MELPSSPDTGTVIKKTITGQHLIRTRTPHVLVKNGAGSTDKIFDVLVPGNKPATTRVTPETATSSTTPATTSTKPATTSAATTPATLPTSTTSAPATTTTRP